MIHGFYGDDVTGSVDALLQWRRRGADAVLVLSPDDVAAVAGHTVVGIAGTARSLATADLDEAVLPAFDAVAPARTVQYKACSTVDSSSAVGSLGRVLELGRERYGPVPVPMLFAQPDFGRYTVFGHHFARDGERVWRLDRQPTMSLHPVTPMDEAEIAVHLGRQTTLQIGAVPWTSYESLNEILRDPSYDAYVLDALTSADVETVGRAVAGLMSDRRPVFCLGSGGLTLGLASAVIQPGLPEPPVVAAAVGGPMLAVSGSCSGRTAEQVEAAEAAGWMAVRLSPEAPDEAARAYHSGRSVVVHSGTQARESEPVDVSGALADVVRACQAARPLSRLLVCGGDTSGRLLGRLGVRSLQIVATPWGNAPLLRAAGGEIDGTEVVLKGGQVGSVDLFEQVRTGQ